MIWGKRLEGQAQGQRLEAGAATGQGEAGSGFAQRQAIEAFRLPQTADDHQRWLLAGKAEAVLLAAFGLELALLKQRLQLGGHCWQQSSQLLLPAAAEEAQGHTITAELRQGSGTAAEVHDGATD